jgi:hypothetical protein
VAYCFLQEPSAPLLAVLRLAADNHRHCCCTVVPLLVWGFLKESRGAFAAAPKLLL